MEKSSKKHELRIDEHTRGWEKLFAVKSHTKESSPGAVLDKVVFGFAKRYAEEEGGKNVIEMLDKADYLFKATKSEESGIALEVESYTIGLLHYFVLQGIGSTVSEVFSVITDDFNYSGEFHPSFDYSKHQSEKENENEKRKN